MDPKPGAQQGHGAVRRWRRHLGLLSSWVAGARTPAAGREATPKVLASTKRLGHGRGAPLRSHGWPLAQPGTEGESQHEASRSEAEARCTARGGAWTPVRTTAGRASAEPEVATADETAKPSTDLSLLFIRSPRRSEAVTDRERWRGTWTAAWRTTRARRCAAVAEPPAAAVWLQQRDRPWQDEVRTQVTQQRHVRRRPSLSVRVTGSVMQRETLSSSGSTTQRPHNDTAASEPGARHGACHHLHYRSMPADRASAVTESAGLRGASESASERSREPRVMRPPGSDYRPRRVADGH